MEYTENKKIKNIIYKHIDESPGKTLLYSQFRSIEGLGVTSLLLKHQGYVEIKLEHDAKTKEWSIVNYEEILQQKYDGKRYIIFDNDRHKTKILLQLYNGFLESESISNTIRDEIYQRFTKENPISESFKKNLRGEFIKLLMISW